jgi:hypothetical protein
MVASYSSSGLNDPRKRLPISATSSSPKRQLSEKAAAERDREVRVEGNKRKTLGLEPACQLAASGVLQ